jgi:hypothetical protein
MAAEDFRKERRERWDDDMVGRACKLEEGEDILAAAWGRARQMVS